jgi:hypothetical protein
MTSQIDWGKMPFPLPYPATARLAAALPAFPVEAGFYGRDWTPIILVTTNQRALVARVGASELADQVTLLCLDAHGYAPTRALAMHLLLAEQVHTSLRDLSTAWQKPSGTLWVPVSMAEAFGWLEGGQVQGWSVHLVPDDFHKIPGFILQGPKAGKLTKQRTPSWVTRLLLAFHFLLSHGIVLAIPLLVFGWLVAVEGLAVFLACLLILSLSWNAIRISGWIKGLLLGILLAVLAGLGLHSILPWNTTQLLQVSVGILLISIWSGWILSGAKSK